MHENHCLATKKNKEWQEKLPVVVLKAEEIMYSKANSEVLIFVPVLMLVGFNFLRFFAQCVGVMILYVFLFCYSSLGRLSIRILKVYGIGSTMPLIQL